MRIIVLFHIFLSFLLAAMDLSIFSCVKICTQERTIQLLDANQSLLQLQDEHRDTLLHYAVRYRRYKLIYYLVKHGADVGAIGANHKTPVDIAIDRNDRVALEYLMLSPTFNRAKNERIQQYLKKEYKPFDDITNENFLESKNRFQQEVREFSKKVQKKSKKKQNGNYIHSEYRHDNKSDNRGNVEIYIK